MQCTILTVDELEVIRFELVEILKGLNVEIINAVSEEEVLRIIGSKEYTINIIIWVVNSGDFKCFEALKRVKGNQLCKDIPIIVVSSFTDKKYVLKAIESGAVEYIARPYDENTVIKKISRITGLLNRISNNEVIEDIITFNFTEMSNKELKAASRGGYPLTFMLVSIIPYDDLNKYEYRKEVNSFTNIVNMVIRSNLRETDTSFHIDVNKIILLLPFADSEGAKIIEEKIYKLFESHSFIRKKNKGHSLYITSASFPEDGKVKDKLLQKLKDNYNSLFRSKTGIGNY